MTPDPAIRSPALPTIVLVSASPRRKAILDRLGIPHRIAPAGILEDLKPGVPAEAASVGLAEAKLRAYLDSIEGEPTDWALAADTVIDLGGRVVGKPESREEARTLLLAFSGRVHRVVTGLALYNPRAKAVATGSASTEVRFARLTSEEIAWYLDTGEWRDAAGGYRIQEKGESLVEGIVGSPSNVMGLPIRAFCEILSREHYPFFAP